MMMSYLPHNSGGGVSNQQKKQSNLLFDHQAMKQLSAYNGPMTTQKAENHLLKGTSAAAHSWTVKASDPLSKALHF